MTDGDRDSFSDRKVKRDTLSQDEGSYVVTYELLMHMYHAHNAKALDSWLVQIHRHTIRANKQSRRALGDRR